jgi:AmmeMemoRadiSam system protein B/AmmeMemoRadiSam system protein A
MAWFMTQCIALAVTVPILHVRAAEGAGEQKVRPAAVAGAFYPADPQVLSKTIDDMLAKAAPPPVDSTIESTIIAAVAPHAGYPYSGPVAAWTYAAIEREASAGHKYSRVVVIAPTHYVGFDFTSVYDGDAYTTPLGQVPVDKKFARELAKMSSTIQLSDKGHQATADAPEHSVEVQLPWLQKILGNFELVPIVMGDTSYGSSRALGVALAKMLRDDHDTLVLASSDLSHFHPYADAEMIDHKTLHALEAYDYYSMSRNFQYRGPGQPGIWEACGGAPIVAAMIYAERMGAKKAEVLRYANSGDVTGDKSRVVGYSADLFIKSAHAADVATPFSLTDQEKTLLLALARKSVEYMIGNKEPYAPPTPANETLNREYGAFTTLTESGALRGCIGYTSPMKPLYMTVRDTATLAALRDPRFAPVTVLELPKLAYEISVLSPLRRVTDVEQIKVGRDGLIVKNGDSEGLLLPQVPVEQSWDRQTFLEQTCRKAGMDVNCWKDESTDIFSFTAVVFNEKSRD